MMVLQKVDVDRAASRKAASIALNLTGEAADVVPASAGLSRIESQNGPSIPRAGSKEFDLLGRSRLSLLRRGGCTPRHGVIHAQ